MNKTKSKLKSQPLGASKELKKRESEKKNKKSSKSAREDLADFFEDSYEKHHGW